MKRFNVDQDTLKCSITHQIFFDPVGVAGEIYEREALNNYIKKTSHNGVFTTPNSGKEVDVTTLYTEVNVIGIMSKYISEHGSDEFLFTDIQYFPIKPQIDIKKYIKDGNFTLFTELCDKDARLLIRSLDDGSGEKGGFSLVEYVIEHGNVDMLLYALPKWKTLKIQEEKFHFLSEEKKNKDFKTSEILKGRFIDVFQKILKKFSKDKNNIEKSFEILDLQNDINRRLMNSIFLGDENTSVDLKKIFESLKDSKYFFISKQTPLHIAIMCKSVKMVRIFIDKKSIKTKNQNNELPIKYASKKKIFDKKVFSCIMSYAKKWNLFDDIEVVGKYFLHNLIKRKYFRPVNVIVDLNIAFKYNEVDDDGKTFIELLKNNETGLRILDKMKKNENEIKEKNEKAEELKKRNEFLRKKLADIEERYLRLEKYVKKQINENKMLRKHQLENAKLKKKLSAEKLKKNSIAHTKKSEIQKRYTIFMVPLHERISQIDVYNVLVESIGKEEGFCENNIRIVTGKFAFVDFYDKKYFERALERKCLIINSDTVKRWMVRIDRCETEYRKRNGNQKWINSKHKPQKVERKGRRSFQEKNIFFRPLNGEMKRGEIIRKKVDFSKFEKFDCEIENTIFIGRLLPSITKNDIISFFMKKIGCAPSDVEIYNRGRKFYSADVSFNLFEETRLALTCDLGTIKNIVLDIYPRLKFDMRPAEKFSIFVRNISMDLNGVEIKKIFKTCGVVFDVRRMKIVNCYKISFGSIDAREKALQMDKVKCYLGYVLNISKK